MVGVVLVLVLLLSPLCLLFASFCFGGLFFLCVYLYQCFYHQLFGVVFALLPMVCWVEVEGGFFILVVCCSSSRGLFVQRFLVFVSNSHGT